MSPRSRDPYNQEATVAIQIVSGVLLGGGGGAGVAAAMGADATGLAMAAIGGLMLGILLALLATGAKIRG